MKNEDEKILREFIQNIYGETITTEEVVNPLTNEIIKNESLDFENNVLKSFYIDNSFKDMYFINVNNNMGNEVVNWLDSKNKENNTFISVNTFKFISRDDYIENKANAITKTEKNKKYVPFRRTGNTVFFSNIVFVDLDFYHTKEYKDKSAIEMYNIIKKEQSRFLKALGAYCFVCSGGGLYLLVKFDKTMYFLNEEYKTLWRNISLGINNRLSKYGADTKCKGDFARIFRCPFSYNNKHNDMKQVYIIENFDLNKARSAKNLYKLVKKDLETLETITVVKEKKEKTEKKEENKIVQEVIYKDIELIKKNNTDDIWHINAGRRRNWFVDQRLYDLDFLLHMRDYKMSGHRTYFLLIYAAIYNLSAGTTEETYNLLLEINNKFTEPLHESKVIYITNCIANTNFKFTNKKIKELLDITAEERYGLALSYTEKDRKEQHNTISQESYNNLHKKMDKKKEKIFDVIKENSDKTNKELMNILNISKSTLLRYKKILKDIA